MLETVSREVYCGCTSKKLTWSILRIYFTHINNIHWLVYREIEVLSFNGEVKHEKLVLPTERVKYSILSTTHNLHRFAKPTLM